MRIILVWFAGLVIGALGAAMLLALWHADRQR